MRLPGKTIFCHCRKTTAPKHHGLTSRNVTTKLKHGQVKTRPSEGVDVEAKAPLWPNHRRTV